MNFPEEITRSSSYIIHES